MSSSVSHKKLNKHGEHSSTHRSKTSRKRTTNEKSRQSVLDDRNNRKRKISNDAYYNQPQTSKNSLKIETTPSSSDDDETDNERCDQQVRKRRRKSCGECCAICLDNIDMKEEKCVLDCAHYFHTVCIKQWLALQKTCPTCRAEIPNFDQE